MCVFVEKWNIISFFIQNCVIVCLQKLLENGNVHETKFHLKAEAKWSKMRALQA